MISWVRSIYEVFKYTCLICKIWGFTERWITCSENKIHINTKHYFSSVYPSFQKFLLKIFSRILSYSIKAQSPELKIWELEGDFSFGFVFK